MWGRLGNLFRFCNISPLLDTFSCLCNSFLERSSLFPELPEGDFRGLRQLGQSRDPGLAPASEGAGKAPSPALCLFSWVYIWERNNMELI